MKRYENDFAGCQVPDEEGTWVKWEDAISSINKLETSVILLKNRDNGKVAQVATLKKTIKAKGEEIEDLKNDLKKILQIAKAKSKFPGPSSFP